MPTNVTTTKRRVPNPTGGIKRVLTAKERRRITKLAKAGSREAGIRLALKLSAPTWLRIKQEDERVVEALQRGHELMHDVLVKDVMRMAKKSIVAAPLFMLKTRHGYRENDPIDEGRGAHVTIQIPGAPRVENIVEGYVIHEPRGDAPGVVRPSLPRTEREPGDAAPMPEAREYQPPHPPQSRESAEACRRFEREVGIDLGRNSFPSEAAWERWNKSR